MSPWQCNACRFTDTILGTSPELKCISMENGNWNHVSFEAYESLGIHLSKQMNSLYFEGASIFVVFCVDVSVFLMVLSYSICNCC